MKNYSLKSHHLILIIFVTNFLFSQNYEQDFFPEGWFGYFSMTKEFFDKEYKSSGYNIGFNYGGGSGQKVFHLHIHIIPKYKKGVEDPRGGVRGAIPSKQKY